MHGTAYRLYAQATTGEWHLLGWHYQSESWIEPEIKMLTKLGIKTRIEEYNTEYANEG